VIVICLIPLYTRLNYIILLVVSPPCHITDIKASPHFITALLPPVTERPMLCPLRHWLAGGVRGIMSSRRLTTTTRLINKRQRPTDGPTNRLRAMKAPSRRSHDSRTIVFGDRQSRITITTIRSTLSLAVFLSWQTITSHLSIVLYKQLPYSNPTKYTYTLCADHRCKNVF